MSDHLATRYVNLTESIAVPEEWPVQELRDLLVSLAEQVIDAADEYESVVLQILNHPAKLVRRQDQNGKRYFFEKVFSECVFLMDLSDYLTDLSECLQCFDVFQRACRLVYY